MDPNLIYEKTASGENAIQQRSQVIPRNVRMVLILVDGQSSVADLTRKTGNLQLTQNALAELEKAGFIEMRDDSLVVESQRVAQEIRSSAAGKAMHSPPKAENHQKHAGDMAANPPVQAEFNAADDAEDLASRFSSLPSSPDWKKPIFVANRRPEQKEEDHPVLVKPSFLARLKSMWRRPERAPNDRPVKLKPIRRRSSSGGRSWLALFVFGFIGLFALGCVAVLLFPFGSFAPDIEKAFSLATGQPVGIQNVRVNIFPQPGLVLGDVRLGQGDDALRIREISLQPDFLSLFSGQKRWRRVVVSGTELRIERIGEMPAIFASLAKPDNSLKINLILLKDTDISFNGIVLRNTEAEIQRDAAGRMQALLARTQDRNVIVEAQPMATGTELMVEAFSWRPDNNPMFISDSLNFKGRLEKGALMISGLEIRIFDGIIQGDAVVRADGAKPNLSGTIVFERINTSRLAEALGIGKKMEGVITGNMRFSANANTWPAIFSAISGEGEFSLQRGSLYGIGLAEAVRRASDIPMQGGTTNFEQMSGRVRLSQEKNQFYDLEIVSGLMQSTGYVDVAQGGQLTGKLELQMKGSANQSRIPVVISGTLNLPAVQSGR
jgi:hypothetical protein